MALFVFIIVYSVSKLECFGISQKGSVVYRQVKLAKTLAAGMFWNSLEGVCCLQICCAGHDQLEFS